jgi:putative ABC transport system permease protein
MTASWRIALRIARREARRARGRTALVFCMIALPVTAIVAVDTLARTSELSPRESVDRQVGDADALVRDGGERVPLDQDALADVVRPRDGGGRLPAPDSRDVLARLPAGSRVVALHDGDMELRTARGAVVALGVGADFSDPLPASVYRPVAGRVPDGPGEIAVTPRLARLGLVPGAGARLPGGARVRVVGTLRGPQDELGNRVVFGAPATLGLPRPTRWLAEHPGGIGWGTVRGLNARGLTVLSRAVAAHPPPADELPAETTTQVDTSGQAAAVLALVVAMALLQVVLLAGPAFAVGAQRRRRALALLAASGGTPRDVRRVVLADGVVIGGAAAVFGTVAGIALAFASHGLLGGSEGEPGPFEVAPLDVGIVAAFGLGSAVLAALAPAVSAGRADLVAGLAGRRATPRGTTRSLTAGLILLGAGAAGAVLGARGAGELFVALAAVPTVLGAVLLAPALLVRAGRVAHRLPLAARLAVRDASRQHARTAPAVGAIAATVAGVVALGVGASSDAAENAATYVPSTPPGVGLVTAGNAGDAAWAQAEDLALRALPGARITALTGIPEPSYDLAAPDGPYERIELCAEQDACRLSPASAAFGSQVLVGRSALPVLELGRAAEARARRVLAAGGAVVYADAPLPGGRISLARVEDVTDPVDGSTRTRVVAHVSARALRVTPAKGMALTAAVLSERLAADLGARPVTTALLVAGATIGTDAEDRLNEALAGTRGGLGIVVERGPEDALGLVLLLLGGLGAVLVLGGTLTATLLALSEARPDFGTLLAIGATPGIRRATAAAYAAAVGLAGALLGALAGLIPGIAIAFPLTRAQGDRPVELPGVFVDVPWLLLAALVVGVPALAAAGVALFTRPRLPMTARRA